MQVTNARNARAAQYRRRRYNPLTTRTPATLTTTSPELKSIDVGSATTTAPGGTDLYCNTASTSIIPLNLIAAGSSFFNRIGRRIELRSIDICFQIQNISGVSRLVPADLLRIMVVYDRQTNGALPSISDIIQDTDSNANNLTNSMSGPNLNNRDRFMVLFDKRVQLPVTVLSTGSGVTFPFPNSTGGANTKDFGFGVHRYYRKLPKLITQYKADSTTPVIGDIATGGVYIFTLCTQNASGSEGFYIINWHSRIRYSDL
jgi:hypothetical protein